MVTLLLRSGFSLDDIRVRFAPSPTGTLHIGGARTALFNWLFARSQGGKFILRLEDTDTERSTENSAIGILDGLKWLGLDWDEGPELGGPYGPYRQSERLSIYRKYLQQLLDEGKAYYCFCTPEEIQNERKKAQAEKRDYKYVGKCPTLSKEEVAHRLSQGLKPVIRFKVPKTGFTIVHDLIREDVEFNNSLFDDFIIAKSDGWPTYNFAVVVDDFSMKISHVIRAEEHLSNTPKQILIYEALGFDMPKFAHVSMILAPDRSKLSKRHGATSVQEFRDDGYLPSALVNYLALLGWSTGQDKDIWSLDEMISQFSLQDVSRSPAIYDLQKLTWMNGHYLCAANIDDIMALIEDGAKSRGWLNDDNRAYLTKTIDLARTRVKTINEIFTEADYFFEDIKSYNEKGIKKYFSKNTTNDIFNEVISIIEKLQTFTAIEIEEQLRKKADDMQIKAGEIIHPVRLALSGRIATPGLFEIMELLGKDRCIARLKNATIFIKDLQNK